MILKNIMNVFFNNYDINYKLYCKYNLNKILIYELKHI